MVGTLGSHCGWLHIFRAPWLPGEDIAEVSELILRSAQILGVALGAQQTNMTPTEASTQAMVSFEERSSAEQNKPTL